MIWKWYFISLRSTKKFSLIMYAVMSAYAHVLKGTPGSILFVKEEFNWPHCWSQYIHIFSTHSPGSILFIKTFSWPHCWYKYIHIVSQNKSSVDHILTLSGYIVRIYLKVFLISLCYQYSPYVRVCNTMTWFSCS